MMKSRRSESDKGRQLYVSSKYFEIVDMKPVKRFIKEVELVA